MPVGYPPRTIIIFIAHTIHSNAPLTGGTGPIDDDDTDNDGIPDDIDPDIDNDNIPNDQDLDDDNDGFNDDQDNCPRTYNPDQDDIDNDDDGDACDDDDDGDSILDEFDQCYQGLSGWISQTSNDRDGDGCEDNLEDNDDDNDLVNDDDDNCPLEYNPSQDDYEGDDIGDVCDDDDDNDGVGDENDDCPRGISNWHSDQKTDLDGDGCHDSDEDPDVEGNSGGILSGLSSEMASILVGIFGGILLMASAIMYLTRRKKKQTAFHHTGLFDHASLVAQDEMFNRADDKMDIMFDGDFSDHHPTTSPASMRGPGYQSQPSQPAPSQPAPHPSQPQQQDPAKLDFGSAPGMGSPFSKTDEIDEFFD